MSDQNVVTDWRAYFDSLPPGTPMDMSKYPKLVQPRIVIEIPEECPMTYVDVQSDQMFDRALELWEANGRPRMWMFYGVGEAPWTCEAAPQPKAQKGRKA